MVVTIILIGTVVQILVKILLIPLLVGVLAGRIPANLPLIIILILVSLVLVVAVLVVADGIISTIILGRKRIIIVALVVHTAVDPFMSRPVDWAIIIWVEISVLSLLLELFIFLILL